MKNSENGRLGPGAMAHGAIGQPIGMIRFGVDITVVDVALTMNLFRFATRPAWYLGDIDRLQLEAVLHEQRSHLVAFLHEQRLPARAASRTTYKMGQGQDQYGEHQQRKQFRSILGANMRMYREVLATAEHTASRVRDAVATGNATGIRVALEAEQRLVPVLVCV